MSTNHADETWFVHKQDKNNGVQIDPVADYIGTNNPIVVWVLAYLYKDKNKIWHNDNNAITQ